MVKKHIQRTKKHIETHYEYYLIAIVAILILLNQFQILQISDPIKYRMRGYSSGDLKDVDITQIKSTAQGISLLFPIDQMKTVDDTIAIMIPTGTPEYGNEMGVTYDDPINSMNAMVKAYPSLKQQAQQNPEIWQHYLSLAAAPRGISCEFCCGVGPQGIDSKGNLKCGCAHSPAVQTVTLWLLQNTDYSDAEILKEVYRWKSLFFPKNMVEIASKISGGDTSVLQDLPGMVGGC